MKILDGVNYAKKQTSICKLKKFFYGLKQSPRAWNQKIDDFSIQEFGFKSLSSDPFFYFKIADNKLFILTPYVDNLLVAANSIGGVSWMKKELNQRFEMKDMNDAKLCLRLEILRDRLKRKLFLCQHKYSLNLLFRFVLLDCRTESTPVNKSKVLEKRLETSCDSDTTTKFPYQTTLAV